MTEREDRQPPMPRRPTITVEYARQLAKRDFARRLEGLLLETGGNVAEVARRLGKDRSTVRYHLRRLGMLGAGDAPADGGGD